MVQLSNHWSLMLSYHRRHRRPSSHWELTILFSIIKTIAPNISECRNGKFLQRQDGVLGKEKKKKHLNYFQFLLSVWLKRVGVALHPGCEVAQARNSQTVLRSVHMGLP